MRNGGNPGLSPKNLFFWRMQKKEGQRWMKKIFDHIPRRSGRSCHLGIRELLKKKGKGKGKPKFPEEPVLTDPEGSLSIRKHQNVKREIVNLKFKKEIFNLEFKKVILNKEFNNLDVKQRERFQNYT